jgi:hydrogenase nickel incorporation protein HypA/HybF
MHELSVTESILDIALRHGAQAGAKRITDLYLVIGQLSSIVDDSVQFYWDMVAKDTIAEGGKLHFERMPVEMVCLECSETYQPSPSALECPNCSSIRVKLVSGNEFFVKAIDVET